MDRLLHGLVVGVPRVSSLLDGWIQEAAGVDLAYGRRPIHLNCLVWRYWLFVAVRSGWLLGDPNRNWRARQLPGRGTRDRWTPSWWTFCRAGYLESLLRGSCPCTALDHSYLDAGSLLVHPQAGHIRSTLAVFSSVSTGERPFGDILTSLRYWVIHSITLPALFLAGWLFVSTGLASEFGGLAV